MTQDQYDQKLRVWARRHYWDSLEKDKELILRHLRTFCGYATEQNQSEADVRLRCPNGCGGDLEISATNPEYYECPQCDESWHYLRFHDAGDPLGSAA